MTDRSESDIISSNPFTVELDSFCDFFRSGCENLGISESDGESSRVLLWIEDQYATMD